MRKHISIILVMALMMSLFVGFGGAAQAEGDVTLTVTPEVTELAQPGIVNCTAAVTNNTTEALTNYAVMLGGNVKYDAGGASLAAGDTNSEITFSLDIGEGLLDTPLTFTVKYETATLPLTDGGSDTVTIAKKQLVTKLGASCTVNQTIVNAGDYITFTYNLENQGETTLLITCKADALKSGALNNEPLTLAPEESTTFKYEYEVGTVPLTIEPYIEYAADGVDQENKILDPIALTSEERHVEPVLSVSNKSPQPGEDVTFTLTLTNSGTVPYTHVTVSYGGQDIGFSSSKLNPGETKDHSYSMSFMTSTDVKFQISLRDHENQTVSVGTNTVRIQLPVDTAGLQANIGLTIAPDVSALTSAGTINFSGFIANDSEYNLSAVSLTEDTLGSIPGIPDTMTPASKRVINFSADIAETTTYNFVLSVTDRNGDTYTVGADPITVTVSSPVVQTPTYDDAAEVADDGITLDNKKPVDKLGIFAILAIVLVVLILGVGIALIVLWRKGRHPRKGNGRKTPAKRPAPRSPAKKKPYSSKNYRDRNNF